MLPCIQASESDSASDSVSSLSEVSRHVHSLSVQLRDLTRSYQALSETVILLRSHLELISARVGRLEEVERIAEIRFTELWNQVQALESISRLNSLD